MRKASLFFASLLLACSAGTAAATIYPPGPGGAFPDTLGIFNIQNPAATPNPALLDTVLGVGGIITAFDTFGSGRAFYIQNRSGNPWTGIDVFTGATDYMTTQGLALGDSVIVYGKVQDFQGGTEIEGFDNSTSSADLIARKISSGNPLPPFRVTTVNQLHELPTNPNAEQWEGMLVKVRTKTRVVRTNVTGGIGPFRWARLVDNVVCPTGSAGPCDTMTVDMATLANPAINPPAVGAIVDSVQGIFEQRVYGYHIEIRNGNDLFIATPPGLARAYMIGNDSIKVVFDRDVTAASAQNLANYSLASFSSINTATLTSPTTVLLTYTDILPAISLETLTVNGIVAAASGLPMTTPQNASFWNKVNTIKDIQAPNTAFLTAPCEDRSRFAGAGTSSGNLVTWRAVHTADFGSLDNLQDKDGGLRSGLAVFGASGLVLGRQYLCVASIQEFFNETEAVSFVEVIDEGVGPAVRPITTFPLVGGPLLTVAAIRDTACDATQSKFDGEDVEGVLIRLGYLKAYEGSPFPGAFIRTAGGPLPTDSDSIQVDSDGLTAYQAPVGDVMSVTGVVQYNFGQFRIAPRFDADIASHGIGIVGIGDQLPSRVTFAVHPNPARTQTLSFGLPVAGEVELSVYDLAGRKITTLAKGRHAAGPHSVSWDGTANGRSLGAGVYFYRLKVNGEEHSIRGVRLN